MTSNRFLTIVNPHGGARRGARVLEQIRPIFDRAGATLDVCLTQARSHAAGIVCEADLPSYTGINVIGGDGSVHDVINGLMRCQHTATPLGLIPAGTGNTVHAELGCSDAITAAEKIIAGRTRAIDLLRVQADHQIYYCVNIIGWGSIADINHTAERLRWLGRSRYSAAALWNILRRRSRRARLTLDDTTLDGEFMFVLACNTRSTGAAMILAPDAILDNGHVDVVVLRATSRRRLVEVFRRVRDGTHLSMDCIGVYRVTSFAIASESVDPLNLDGEMTGTTPLTAQVIASALRVYT